jgi:hypothetical protein
MHVLNAFVDLTIPVAAEATQLAFVAELQQLPEPQRAALVLRDVLGFRTEEVAAMLDVAPQSVKGALQRARATLDERVSKRAPLPDSAAERKLVALFSGAVEAGDTARVVALLTDEVRLTMPAAARVHTPRGSAFGCYLHSHAWGMLALTLSGEQIAEITFFSDPSLVGRFGVPHEI